MFGLLAFGISVVLLCLGYALYGRVAERVYGGDTHMAMPCDTQADGVDYVRMPTWKVFLIQLLNIAGLGPVFGALAGCLFGPIALVRIVVGCILGGAMHDFMAAWMSAEHGGANLPQLVGRYLGNGARHTMRLLCVVLLLMVGVVFTSGPAGMLHAITGSSIPLTGWCAIIMGYYVLATILPINTLIGKLYPIFGALFLFMAIGLAIALPLGEHPVLPELDPTALTHPKELPFWPMIFVTIACGAISGFHATQSPMMVRCLSSARLMRPVFYGAMITEGLVALVWATVGLTLRDVATDYILTPGGPQLATDAAEGARATFMQLSMASPAAAVNQACTALLGSVGAVLAVLGVVALPITSGDTAMRSCRLIVAEATGLSQRSIRNRLLIAVPLFAAVICISQLDFAVVWRYFGWANQALACFTLWSIAICLRSKGRCHWIATLPALFMTCMCTTFLLYSPDCLIELPIGLSSAIGCVTALLCLLLLRRARSLGK